MPRPLYSMPKIQKQNFRAQDLSAVLEHVSHHRCTQYMNIVCGAKHAGEQSANQLTCNPK